jgi:hypothetical protein
LQRLELLVEDVLVKLMQQMQQDTSERSSVANGVQEAQQGVQDPKSAKSSETDVKPKKPRKPYVLTRPREAWTPEEHQKFLEAREPRWLGYLIFKLYLNPGLIACGFP